MRASEFVDEILKRNKFNLRKSLQELKEHLEEPARNPHKFSPTESYEVRSFITFGFRRRYRLGKKVKRITSGVRKRRA